MSAFAGIKYLNYSPQLLHNSKLYNPGLMHCTLPETKDLAGQYMKFCILCLCSSGSCAAFSLPSHPPSSFHCFLLGAYVFYLTLFPTASECSSLW